MRWVDAALTMLMLLVPGLVAVVVGTLLWGPVGAVAGMCVGFGYVIGLVAISTDG